jgi:lipopolysaccharide export system permease protein
MGSIGRYIFLTTAGAFLMVLVSVTTLIWITQALRDIDLITTQGQSVFVFVALTGLIIPLLVLTIAPISFMVAMAYVLNKLGNDSELIAMNAAGMKPWQLFRPFLALAAIVSILVATIAAYLSPKCLRELGQWINEIRADVVTRVVQPGRFIAFAEGLLVVQIKDRLPNGHLAGIFIDDQRNRQERETLVAEGGDIFTNERGTYLLLTDGSLQRQRVGERDPSIVQFDRYAFDLSLLSGRNDGPKKYSARELYIWELFDSKEEQATFNGTPEQMLAELNDRLLAPFYPLAIGLLTFAYLGAPRTTRQSRSLSVFGAIGAVAILRGSGFVGILAGAHVSAALLIPYAVLLAASVLGYRAVSRGVIIEAPTFLVNAVTALTERIARSSPAAG